MDRDCSRGPVSWGPVHIAVTVPEFGLAMAGLLRRGYVKQEVKLT